jgi:cell division protein FtsA
LPVRLARPDNLIGLVDQLHSPAYSTSVGLLYFALAMNESAMPARGGGRFVSKGNGPDWFGKIVEFLKKISP